MRQSHECTNVEIYHPQFLVYLKASKITVRAKPRVVYKPFDLETVLLGFLKKCLVSVSFRKIEHNIMRHYGVLEHELVAQLVQSFFGSGHEDEIVLFGGLLPCEFFADAARRACDQGDFHSSCSGF